MLQVVQPVEPALPALQSLPHLLGTPEGLAGALSALTRAGQLGLRSSASQPGRTVLHRDGQGEVVLAMWTGQESCAPHDHGRSQGAVWVLEGSVRECWVRAERGLYRTFAQHVHGPCSLLPLARGVIHTLEPLGPAVTLHVYAPQVSCMRVFERDPADALAPEERGWIPRDVRLVNGRACCTALGPRR
jgi:hypothetical protein